MPNSFVGYKIAHVSDLHNATFGKENDKLLNKIKNSECDIIAITGDIFDSRNTKIDVAIDFVEEALKIAPVFYITGNHEKRLPYEYAYFEDSILDFGAIVLHGEDYLIEKDGSKIQVIGIDDYSYYNNYNTAKENTIDDINNLKIDEYYSILLAHRPLLNTYSQTKVDLVLSGHIHGGQFRIPFVGAVLSPELEIFPTYSSGLYTQDETTMYLSRGLGNSIIPIRINNKPELVIIELDNTL